MTRSRTLPIFTCAIAVAAFTVFFFLSGTALAADVPELLSELPSGAPTLIYIDLVALRASSFYQQRPDHGPIAVPNRDYADFVRSTGFDFEKDLDRVLVGSWPASAGQERKRTIVIADGRFDRAKIREYAVRKGKLDRQQGHDVFLFPNGDHQSWNAVIFLADHRVAISDSSNISLLAPHAADSAADPARDRAARVAGAAVFSISRIPPIPEGAAPAGAQSAQIMSLARSIQWITLAAQPEGNNLRVSLEGECATSSDARRVQSTLELLRLFGSAALASPKTRQSMKPATYEVLQALLKSAEVTQSAERVRILLELTPDVLKLSEPRKTQ